jgi:hypothetical protein
MLKQSTCTAYVNVQQKIHRTAQLIQTANKQTRTSPAPLPFPCTTGFTTESTPYLVNEDTVGQGLPICTTRRVCRDRDRVAGSTISSCRLDSSLHPRTSMRHHFLSIYYFSRSL